MKAFWIDTAVMTSFFFPAAILTFSVLWKLRSKGVYTVLLGFVFQIVLTVLGFAIAPRVMHFHREPGMSPAGQGIGMGCVIPMVIMLLYYMAEHKKRKQVNTEATTPKA